MAKKLTNNALALRLEEGVRRRMALLRLPLPGLAADLGHDVTTLRAWFRGANRFSFEDIDRLDGFFAQRGLPGLIDELRQHGRPRNWAFNEEAYSTAQFNNASLGDLHQLTEGLQQSGRSPLSFLQERGLFEHCHILNIDDGGVRVIHLGEAVPVQRGANVLGRDLRDLADRDYGLMLHDQMMRIAQDKSPRVHLIQSVHGPQVQYRRLAVPVGPHFIIAVPYDVTVSPEFAVQ